MATKKKEERVERIVKQVETRLLPVVLTDEELLKFSAKLADCHATIVNLENELTSFKEENKAKMAVEEASVSRFSNLIRQRYEHREVPCTVVKNWDTQILTVKRNDTGAMVDERKMTSSELSELPMETGSAKKPDAKEPDANE